MANTYELIASSTVGSGGAASVYFMNVGSIPSTYTDLCVKLSLRTTAAGSRDDVKLTLNEDTGSNYSARRVFGIDGGTNSQSSSGSPSSLNIGSVNGNTSTSNTFSNIEFYVSNYADSYGKSISLDWVASNNSTDTYVLGTSAILWSNSNAVTSFKIESKAGNSFVEGSTAYLYGIKNS